MVSGATKAVKRLSAERPDRLGVLICPGKGFVRSTFGWGLSIAADNGAFSGLDRPAYLRMLAGLVGVPVAWVTVPDVVADATETLRLFEIWEPIMRELGLPPALVAQDGLTSGVTPWDRIACLFIGGSTQWKLGSQASVLAKEAKQRGKLLHMGRVNSLRRIETAARLNCDTIDGTGFTSFSDIRIPLAIRWIDRSIRLAATQAVMW